MRIIQIMPEFLFGGAEIMCENLSNELKKMGHDVIIISLYDLRTPITERLLKSGIKVIYLNKKPGLDVSLIPKLRKLFIKIKPDVIHTHRYVMEYVVPASIGLKIKRIHTLHSVATKENTRFGRTINHAFFKINKVVPIALSENVQETIVDEYKLKKEQIPIIYNGVDIRKELQKKSYATKDLFRLIHIGRFALAKNHAMLLEAVKHVKEKHNNLMLTLVGDGELKDEMYQYAKVHNMLEYVNFAGTTNNVYKFLENADAFILPSIYEGMPMTLIEAMGYGMPIIASNVGGIPNMIIDDYNGILTEPTVEDICESIEKIIDGGEVLRQSYGKNAIISSSKFSSKKMAEEYLKIYAN